MNLRKLERSGPSPKFASVFLGVWVKGTDDSVVLWKTETQCRWNLEDSPGSIEPALQAKLHELDS